MNGEKTMSVSRIILASASPRRKELLHQCGVPDFEIIPSHAEEIVPTEENLHALMLVNACLKADDVAHQYPDALVIGADTMIEFEGQAIGKPQNTEDAVQQLLRFAGKKHVVTTGVCLKRLADHLTVCFAVSSEVGFKPFDRPVAEKYVQLVDPLDKAGSYAIQEHADLIIAGYSGSLSNVIGLPVERLTETLYAVSRI